MSFGQLFLDEKFVKLKILNVPPGRIFIIDSVAQHCIVQSVKRTLVGESERGEKGKESERE